MLVRDAMLPNPLLVSPTTTILDFVNRVLDSNQTAAVVIDDKGALCGLVSVHDVFQAILPHYVSMEDRLAAVIHEGYFEERATAFKSMTVADLMVTEVDCISPDDAVIKAVGLFVRTKRKTLPVIKDGQFIGTITRRSLLRKVTTPDPVL